MGVFDFVKAAGRKLGILHDSSEGDSNKGGSASTADEIKSYIERLNLGIENLKVHVDGDKAVIEGKTPSYEVLEKAILAAGNTAGIAAVDSQMQGPAHPTAPSRFYLVKSGDTLSKIAKELLGDGRRYGEIFEANRPLLKDPNEIYPGQNLRVPS